MIDASRPCAVILTERRLLYRRAGEYAVGCVDRDAIAAIEYGKSDYVGSEQTLRFILKGSGARDQIELFGLPRGQGLATLSWFYGRKWPASEIFDLADDPVAVEAAWAAYEKEASS